MDVACGGMSAALCGSRVSIVKLREAAAGGINNEGAI
jgi:hypothetical protein